MSADTSPLQRTSSSRPVPPKEGAQVEEEEEFDTREALPHFRLLVEFIDEFLARQVLLLQQLNRGFEDRIAFEDFWMLYDAGVNIYCPSQEGGVVYDGNPPVGHWGAPGEGGVKHTTKARYVPQIFRVVGTTGGLSLRSPFLQRGTARNKGHRTTNGNAFSRAFLRDLTALSMASLRRSLPSSLTKESWISEPSRRTPRNSLRLSRVKSVLK